MKLIFLLLAFFIPNVFSNNFLNDDRYSDQIKVNRNEDTFSFCIKYGAIDQLSCYEPIADFNPMNMFVTSKKKGEIIVFGKCCGHHGDSVLNYHRYIPEINDWVLFKSTYLNDIGPHHNIDNNYFNFI